MIEINEIQCEPHFCHCFLIFPLLRISTNLFLSIIIHSAYVYSRIILSLLSPEYFRTARLLFITTFKSFQTADKRFPPKNDNKEKKERKKKKEERTRYRNLFIIQLLKLRSNLHLLASNLAKKGRKKKEIHPSQRMESDEIEQRTV